MKHILLTGATGFLGSHLLSAMLKQGFKVTILKRTTSDTWRIDHLLERVRAVDVDVSPLKEAFTYGNVDAVIHTACSYGRHGEAAYELVESNVSFGLRVLDAAIFYGTSAFINTDTVLPKYLNSYSTSKKHFVEWIKQYSEKIQIVNLRLEHMFGPMDDATKLVPWLISQLDENVVRIPLTEGNQLRDFIYIDDVISAYLTVINSSKNLPEFSEFDVATGEPISVREFVVAIHSAYKKRHLNNNTELGFGDIPMRDGDMTGIIADTSGLNSLGWVKQYTLAQGISKLYGGKV